MRSDMSPVNRGCTLWMSRGAGYLVLLALAAGCSQPDRIEDPVPAALDLSRDGQYTSGNWTYTYSITNPGTRSEGYHGVLSYGKAELPVPVHINDFYETPWGRLYWVGDPVVLFGAHRWMPKPLAREPAGRALIDPGIAHSGRFLVLARLVAPGELATPDRLERDPAMQDALKPFGLTEVHVQSNWFPVGADPITLHDTKRWGTLTVCRADLNRRPTPALEFTCTSEFTVDTSPKPLSIAEIMAIPEFPPKPDRVFLSPQADTLQPIRCTLSPIVGDPLVLYLVCRIQDQGPTPPWKSPPMRQLEAGQSARAGASDSGIVSGRRMGP